MGKGAPKPPNQAAKTSVPELSKHTKTSSAGLDSKGPTFDLFKHSPEGKEMKSTKSSGGNGPNILSNSAKEQRLVIIGAGPTALGAAKRLFELGIMRTNTQVVILEQESYPGGLAISQRDKNGFLWDMGGHVVFSHYTYFDQSLDEAVPEWNLRTRAAFAFMKGNDNKRRFIPYPVQESIDAMDKEMQDVCLRGLEEITLHPRKEKPVNFDEWLLKNFGEGLCDAFMRKYNRKVWTLNSTDMNAAWVGERVAVPNIEKIKAKIAAKGKIEDTSWGPNRFFRFPKYGGTGAIWKSIASQLPQGWFYYSQSVVGVNLKKKTLSVAFPKFEYELKYDILITTAPLDTFVGFVKETDSTTRYMQTLAQMFVHSHTHVIGIGLKGQPPPSLLDKSWIYFPDSDSPFYRVTVFSNYSNDHVPHPGKQWSLMCEAAEPKVPNNPEYWTEGNLVTETVRALVDYGYITEDQVVSRYHRRLHHGYPVPFLIREELLHQIQPWLESHNVYSRGRFGGWRYEVSNQDHSFLQGVEIAEFIMTGAPEQTYPDPNKVNSQKNEGHTKQSVKTLPEFEFVVSHAGGKLNWLEPYSSHCHLYHSGKEPMPRYTFRQWDRLPRNSGESYAYLHHIVTNYDYLADVTVFFNDRIGSYQEKGFAYKDITRYVEQAEREGLSFKAPGQTLSKLDDGLSKFWTTVFDDRFKRPSEITFTPGSCFGVTRERIHKHSKEFYSHILSQIQQNKQMMEKLWIAIFSSDVVST